MKEFEKTKANPDKIYWIWGTGDSRIKKHLSIAWCHKNTSYWVINRFFVPKREIIAILNIASRNDNDLLVEVFNWYTLGNIESWGNK